MSPVETTGIEETPPASAAGGGRTIGRSLGLLSVARMAQMVSSFVVGVLLRVTLGPVRVGVWNFVEVWRQQLASLSFGVHYASDRDMPMLRAQGRGREEDEMRWVTLTWMVAEALVLALGFWVYWLVDLRLDGGEEALGLALVPILATQTTIVGAYEGFLVNRKQWELRAWIGMALTVLDWTMLLWVWLGGLRWLLIGLLVSWTIRVLVYAGVVRRLRLFTIRLRLRWKQLAPMLRFGLPLSLWNVFHSLLSRLDSLVVGTVLGTGALGLYYLGPQVALSLTAIPNMLSVISYPQMMETFGRSGWAELKSHIKQYQQAMLVIGPLTAAAGVFGVEVLVNLFLADFRPGLSAMKVVIVAVVFSQTAHLSLQVLLAAKRVALLMAVTAVAVGAQLAVLGIGALGDLTITTAAWSSVAGQGGFAVLSLIAASRLLGVDRREATQFWARLPLGWVGFAALIFAIDALAPDTTDPLGSVAVLFTELAAFAAIGIAVLWAVDREALSASRKLMATRNEPVSGA